MPIGNSHTNNFQLNNQAGQLAVSLRDTCTKILALQSWTASQGVPGLQEIGFTAADAAAFIAEVGELAGAAVADFAPQGGISGKIAGLTGPS
jgi:hypothetical protein